MAVHGHTGSASEPDVNETGRSKGVLTDRVFSRADSPALESEARTCQGFCLRLVRSVTCPGLLATLTPDAVPAHRALSLCQALSEELCVTESF